MVLVLLLAAYAPPVPRDMEDTVPVTDATLSVTDVHTVSGVETYDQILVGTSGTVIVPNGASLIASSLMMSGDSGLEMTGGTILLRSGQGGLSPQMSGMCHHVDLTRGSTIRVWGGNGSAGRDISMGSSAILSLRARFYITISDSTVEVLGGHGRSPEAPFGTGPLSGNECSGGDATLSLVATSSDGAVSIRSSTVRVLAGSGGDAPDGQPQAGTSDHDGGGYSAGGAVSGHVGQGGSSSFGLSGDVVDLDSSIIVVTGGDGGDAGDGGQVLADITTGGGGGGYSGGMGSSASGEYPVPGGRVSQDVGSGGDVTMDLAGDAYVQSDTNISLKAGNGGAAGKGGASRGLGGGGGGGYSGGGGGSTSEPTGAPGNIVSDGVGSGGDATASVLMSDDVTITGSTLSVIAGSGGRAGDGGESIGHGGGGGGGFSGGGGAGSSYYPGFVGKPLMGGDGNPVAGQVATGGDAALRVNSSTGYMANSDVHTWAGDGGPGGKAGRSWQDPDTDVWLGGGGGGSYSAGGGGAFSIYSTDTRGGGDASLVSDSVGDGGDGSLRLEIVTNTIHRDNNITCSRGASGLCWRSRAAGLTGGDGGGKFTRDGRAHTFIPKGRTHLVGPPDGYESGELPLFTWKPLHASTTNGPVMEWSIEVAREPYFIQPIYQTLVENTSLKLYSLDKGTLHWRVTPLYSRPERKAGIPSEAFIYTHLNSPPVVLNVPTVNITVRVPRTVDLYPYVSDSDDPIDSLSISFDSNKILWRRKLLVTFLYDRYEPSHDIVFRVTDGMNTTEGSIRVRILDDNHDPVLLGLGDINPPVIIVLAEGESRKYPVRFYDRDGDPVTIHLMTGWDGVSLVENNTVHINAAFGDVGTYEPVIVARDDRGGRSQMTLLIRVGNVGEPPEPPVFITPGNGSQYNEGDAVVFTVGLKDPDLIFGDILDLTVISSVSGVLMSTEANGTVTFTVDDLGPGRHRITAIVEDGDISKRTEMELVVVGDPEPTTVWDPPDELWLVLGLMAVAFAMLVIGYLMGHWRRKARRSLG
jgi:hypothetical protein